MLIAALRNELLIVRLFVRTDFSWILQVVAIHPGREG